jgi:serine/threonine-protein kinase
LAVCPTCKSAFGAGELFCPNDGSPLGPTPADSDPLVGRVLSGRYRLVEKLGRGGMGTVYRAVHTLMDKPVAVKVLRGELATDGEAVARFHREAKSASRLDHDHCIRVSDFGQSDDGLLFLVMELLDGVSLGTVVRRGPLESARAAAVGLAIAEALAHAHEEGVVHRDLKPDNVFLAKRGRREVVKVLDFGLAKLVHDGTLGPSITRDGTVFGTPEYMAPEQAQGEKLDGRTDIYALGVLLYQLVTGDVPFKSTNFVALLTKHVSEEPESTLSRRPDLNIPDELDDIILRCMAKDRADRFPTASAVAAALAPLAAPVGVDPSQPAIVLPRDEPVQTPLGATRPGPPPTGQVPDDEARVDSSLSLSALRNDSTEMPSLPPQPARSRAGLWALLTLLLLAGSATGGWAWWRARHKLLTVDTATPTPVEPKLDPDSVAGLVAQAEKRLGSGDLAGAEPLLRTARQRGDSAPLQMALATLEDKRGRHLQAMAHLTIAARLDPKDPRPRAQLAELLIRKGQLGDACKMAKAAVDIDPKHDPARTLADQACKKH